MSNRRRMALAAVIIASGTIFSRFMGLIRETVFSHFFGAGPTISAYTISDQLLSICYDLLIGGMISAALIPVLSGYAEKEQKEEFGHIFSTLLCIGLTALAIVALILELVAPFIVGIMANEQDAAYKNEAITLFRLVVPALVLLGFDALLQSSLYSRRIFAYSALSQSMRNIALVTIGLFVAVAFHATIYAFAVGVIIGGVLMILVQLPGLRGIPLHISFDLKHPAIRRIGRLYLPIFLGLTVTIISQIFDRYLANSHMITREAIPAMRYSTFLVQFSIGLVGSAISLAILPNLSRAAEGGDEDTFRRTLFFGLRTITVIVIPLMVLLFILGRPIIGFLFEHGDCDNQCATLVDQALKFYLPGMPASALDYLLVFAFYARKNTILPVLAGVARDILYFLIAPTMVANLGMVGLVSVNSIQQIFHLTIMVVLLRRLPGKMTEERFGSTFIRVCLATFVMALVVGGSTFLLQQALHPDGQILWFITALLPAGIGGLIYLGMSQLLGVGEINEIFVVLKRRLQRATPAGTGD